MSETLWITLPIYEENALKEILNLIVSKNLTNLSINQLIEKIENYQAADWLEILGQYNSIPSINNINLSQILTRANSVKNKFDRKNSENQIIYPNLKNEPMTPNQLLSLVILCYSNPNLIGPKLCKALNEGDEANVKKEILENSARVGDRVAPWASNLRLINYAFYANDTAVKLPVNIINRVKNETIQKRLVVTIEDFQGDFQEVVNGPERSSRGVRSTNHETELDSYQILQSLQSDEEHTSENGQFIRELSSSSSMPENTDYPLIDESASVYNAANASNGNNLLISSLVGFYFIKNLPVISPVLRNMGKDLVAAGKHVGSFFSKNNSEYKEEMEQKTPLLSSIAKP